VTVSASCTERRAARRGNAALELLLVSFMLVTIALAAMTVARTHRANIDINSKAALIAMHAATNPLFDGESPGSIGSSDRTILSGVSQARGFNNSLLPTRTRHGSARATGAMRAGNLDSIAINLRAHHAVPAPAWTWGGRDEIPVFGVSWLAGLRLIHTQNGDEQESVRSWYRGGATEGLRHFESFYRLDVPGP